MASKDKELADILKEKKNMNRSRNLTEYRENLDVDIMQLAIGTVKRKGRFRWYDLCCGNFVASYRLMSTLNDMKETQGKVKAIGIDLVAPTEGAHLLSGARIIRANAATYKIPPDADLVTCLQGLRYIEQYLYAGYEAVSLWHKTLPADALLAFDFFGMNISAGNGYLEDVIADEFKGTMRYLPLDSTYDTNQYAAHVTHPGNAPGGRRNLFKEALNSLLHGRSNNELPQGKAHPD